jgi:hypothetical protein
MLPIPQDVLAKFDAILRERAVPAPFHADYRKWLRYFLDFRSKYPLPEPRSEQVRLFIRKLQEKKHLKCTGYRRQRSASIPPQLNDCFDIPINTAQNENIQK